MCRIDRIEIKAGLVNQTFDFKLFVLVSFLLLPPSFGRVWAGGERRRRWPGLCLEQARHSSTNFQFYFFKYPTQKSLEKLFREGGVNFFSVVIECDYTEISQLGRNTVSVELRTWLTARVARWCTRWRVGRTASTAPPGPMTVSTSLWQTWVALLRWSAHLSTIKCDYICVREYGECYKLIVFFESRGIN